MPRDLADVLHYFLPEIDPDTEKTRSTPTTAPLEAAAPLEDTTPLDPPTLEAAGTPATEARRRNTTNPATALPLPILGLPIGERDVVRSALAWNLAIETSRLGASTLIVTPSSDRGSPLWPEPGPGPLGTELIFCPVTDLDSLYRVASELAQTRTDQSRRGGVVFVRIPPAWLTRDAALENPIRWLLLLTSSNRRDLKEAYDLARNALAANPNAEIGVTIHGVTTIAEAKNAFEYLSRISLDELGLVLASYGLLVDDLHVYRAIAAQRPIGLAHPQAPATRALMDVARLLYEDARSRFLG